MRICSCWSNSNTRPSCWFNTSTSSNRKTLPTNSNSVRLSTICTSTFHSCKLSCSSPNKNALYCKHNNRSWNKIVSNALKNSSHLPNPTATCNNNSQRPKRNYQVPNCKFKSHKSIKSSWSSNWFRLNLAPLVCTSSRNLTFSSAKPKWNVNWRKLGKNATL